MQLTKEKNLAIISSLKDSTAALTKKQEEKRKVDAIMASIQGPQFNVDFFNKRQVFPANLYLPIIQ